MAILWPNKIPNKNLTMIKTEAVSRGVLYKKRFIKRLKNSQENSCPEACKKRLQCFSCEFCEIFNNTIFKIHLRTTASIKILHS